MKKIILILSLLMAAMLPPKETFASHSAAGEITYEWISDSTYRFFFALYRDCAGIVAPDSQKLCFDNPCNMGTNFSLMMFKALGQNGTTLTGCPGYPSSCDQQSGSYYQGFERWVYSGIATMPARCSSWRLSTQLSDRNGSWNFAYGTAFYTETMMNNTGSFQGNSSPYFTSLATPYVCINSPSSYNNGAVDPDGDSLATQLIMTRWAPDGCLPPTNATFAAAQSSYPYSIPNNPFQTNYTFSLNAVTGTMTFTPTQIGAGALSTRTREYRNGVLIGYVDREVQVQVLNCVPSVTTFGASQQGTIQACAGQQLNFCWWGKAGNSNSRLVGSDNHSTTLPGSTVSYPLQATDSVSGCLSWTPTINQLGWHTLNITMKDSTCNASNFIPTYHHWSVQIFVTAPTLGSTDTAICPGTALQLNTSTGGPYVWSVISGTPGSLSCTNCPNPIATPTTLTKYQVMLNGPSACASNKDTITVDVVPHLLPSASIVVAPDTNVLAGTTVTFSATSTNCNNPTYQWQRNGSDLPGAKQATWSSANLANLDVITVKMTCSDTCIIDTPSNKLTMHIGVGVKDIGLNTMTLHPNPNTGEFTITGHASAKEISVEIVSITGQMMYKQDNIATDGGQVNHKLNIGNISNGHYMLRIKTTDKVFTERLTIQR